ncbi:cysteine--tRNA ligase [Planctomicrobium piriforme]|uniref:Cysteine--tRNA ligase n=1 Tax=Planctomicrobium piriforme TaxID=1576369 RepID=A0A1I3AT31_9PLAN|nr:cysteine--tRNA ligase [Planctomicrobium piriforme]SFH53182.1 cysteinyl-tRNA synthetase [Planctomicrobium piriforme]
MALRVYSTLTKTKDEFKTIEPGKVSMYLCGPTVYKPAHIGHMVGPVIFDTVKRYLTYSGYKVTFVVNITDVDDKLINKAKEKGMEVKALAEQMTEDYFDNLKLMGIDTIDHFPYATDYIGAMQEMIQGLIDKGSAYELNGDVYFSVTHDADYGKLSGRSVEQMLAGTRVEANDRKQNPADFALWKSSKAGEPAWDSPWGPGRPGWHIECSAMSSKLLGDSIDIHGGGLDLMFPHHENELAQSESASGKTFVKYWLHNGLMQSGKNTGKVGGAHNKQGDVAHDHDAQIAGKLAGSAGAESVKTAVFAHQPPEVVRFFLLSTHYRSPIDFSLENIANTGKAMDGFYRMFETAQRILGSSFYELKSPATRTETTDLTALPDEVKAAATDLRDRFWEAMDDDFNTGGAIGMLFELRRTINGFVAHHKLEEKAGPEQKAQLTTLLTLFKELSNVVGVFRQPQQKNAGADNAFVNGLMDLILDIRKEARATKNWGVADKIRNKLTELKVVVEDGKEGVRWTRG